MKSSEMPAFGAVDLTNCDREPIHIPGSIQPHGILLTLNPENFAVLQVAGDTQKLLGLAEADLRAQGVMQHMGQGGLARVRKLAMTQRGTPAILAVYDRLTIGKKEFEALIHISDGVLVIEIVELKDADRTEALEIVQGMVARLQNCKTIEPFLEGIAAEIRRVTDFDRVMVYQFLPDDSGHVVAEARADHVESYLDLHYPASDIPVQARRLYVENWIRLIPT